MSRMYNSNPHAYRAFIPPKRASYDIQYSTIHYGIWRCHGWFNRVRIFEHEWNFWSKRMAMVTVMCVYLINVSDNYSICFFIVIFINNRLIVYNSYKQSIIRYMIILGCATSTIGIVVFIFLPDRAQSRWFRLTPTQMIIVHEREQDSAIVQQKSINFEHIKEAVKELRLYCYILIAFLLNLVNGAMSLYSTLIIKTLGHFSVSKSLAVDTADDPLL